MAIETTSLAEPEMPPADQPEEFSLPGPENLEGETGFAESNLIKLLTPEIVVLIWAMILDLIPVILIFFGLDDFWTTDILGMLTISLWSFLRSQAVVAPQRVGAKTKKGLSKFFLGKWSRFLTPIIGEVVPYLGVGPWWTLSVYYQLTA